MSEFSSNRRTWYSDTKPKGKGYIDPSSYNFELSDVMDKIYYNNPSILGLLSGEGVKPRPKQEVAEIQGFLTNIGYLDNKSDVDSLWGPKTAGAVHRYLLNKPGKIARLIDWIGDE